MNSEMCHACHGTFFIRKNVYPIIPPHNAKLNKNITIYFSIKAAEKIVCPQIISQLNHYIFPKIS